MVVYTCPTFSHYEDKFMLYVKYFIQCEAIAIHNFLEKTKTYWRKSSDGLFLSMPFTALISSFC